MQATEVNLFIQKYMLFNLEYRTDLHIELTSNLFWEEIIILYNSNKLLGDFSPLVEIISSSLVNLWVLVQTRSVGSLMLQKRILSFFVFHLKWRSLIIGVWREKERKRIGRCGIINTTRVYALFLLLEFCCFRPSFFLLCFWLPPLNFERTVLCLNFKDLIRQARCP